MTPSKKPEPPDGADSKSKQTAPGVRMLKQIWNIPTKRVSKETVGEVVSDIYRVPPRKNGIPPRSRGNT
ncbi:MAG TPA: hypothetical protein VIH35_08375 [Kiritimatiellia bacterium]|jgi:hypothetical protein